MNFAWAHAIERDTSAYTHAGHRLVSVTEALAIAGYSDFSQVPPDRLEHAANRGKLAHAVTAAMDLGQHVDLDDPKLSPYCEPAELKPYIAAYEKFRADTDFVPELVEQSVKNLRFRYAGTLDRYGLLNGQQALIDLKCSVSLPWWVGCQLAGYEIALREGWVDGPVRRFALRLKPDGNYHLKPYTDLSDATKFMAAVTVVNARIQHGGLTLE